MFVITPLLESDFTGNDFEKYGNVLHLLFKFEKKNKKLKPCVSAFNPYDVMESFIHLNYLGPSDEGSPTTRTVTVHKVCKFYHDIGVIKCSF
jgi:hypothetical protein